MAFRSDGSKYFSRRSDRADIERANRKTRDAIAKLEAQKQVLYRTERELQKKNHKLNSLMAGIKSGKVNTLYGASTESGAVSIQDAGLTKENERLIAELKRSNQKFRQVFELSYDGIAIIDIDGNILEANQKAEEMLGCSKAAMSKFKVSNYCSLDDANNASTAATPEDAEKKDCDNVSDKADSVCQRPELQPGQNIEVELEDGRIVEMSLVLIDWDEQSVYLVTLHDITLRKNSEEKLIQLARYDHLTGLANRSQCIEHLERVLARAERNNGYIAVLFMDLDKFKDINDSMGHDEGDRLLKSVAARLNICIRKSDLAARFGGDEFVLILDEIKQPEDAGFIAQKILQIMKTPHVLNNSPTVVGCSIGIATYPLCGVDPEALFKAADIAMFHSKTAGRNQCSFYVEEMQQELKARIHIERELGFALERDEFMLYYQPQVDITTGSIVAMEALLRWEHSEDGFIAPDQFIPLAEKSGLIVEIGDWVLRTVCQQTKVWQDDLYNKSSPARLVVAVNISFVQLKQKDFSKKLKLILEETNFASKLLELELTESTMMDDPQAVAAKLKQIHSEGIDIAMDDFGTGYSSLSYLRRFSLSTLKIDKSFIAEIGYDEQSEMIIKAIISMAHNLNLRVVAEGVETAQHVAFLQRHQCDLMQGYYFAKPMSFEQASLFLQKGLVKMA